MEAKTYTKRENARRAGVAATTAGSGVTGAMPRCQSRCGSQVTIPRSSASTEAMF